MFIRYFVALCAVVFCVVAINADVEAEPISTKVEARANPAVKIVIKLISSLFTGAAVSCVGEAGNKCKQHSKNPKAAISCAKDFLKANKGRCAVGK